MKIEKPTTSGTGRERFGSTLISCAASQVNALSEHESRKLLQIYYNERWEIVGFSCKLSWNYLKSKEKTVLPENWIGLGTEV
jgi:hypothetical protein